MPKKQLRLLTGISIDYITAETMPILKSILLKFDNLTLLWKFSSASLFENKAAPFIIELLAPRLQKRNDMLAIGGYAGVSNPLLTLEELEAEINWALRNPWGSGVQDIFKRKPDFFIPPVPDLFRAEALTLYHKADLNYIACQAQGRTPDYIFAQTLSHSEKIKIFSYLPLSLKLIEKTGDKIINLLPPGLSPLFILAAINSSSEVAALAKLLEDLSFITDLQFMTTSDLATLKPSPRSLTPDLPTYELGSQAISQLRVLKLSSLRGKAATKPEDKTRAILLFLKDESPLETDTPSVSLKPKTSTSTANMPGEVVLPGTGFDTHFKGGKFDGFFSRQQPLLPCDKIMSLLMYGRTIKNLFFDKTFSLALDELRGLTTSFYQPDAQGQVELGTLYYFTVADYPYLFMTISYNLQAEADPHFKRLIPLSIPVVSFPQNQPCKVEGFYVNGGKSIYELSQAGWFALAGTVFKIRLNCQKYLSLGFILPPTDIISFLPIQVELKKKDLLLRLEPFSLSLNNIDANQSSFRFSKTIYLTIHNEDYGTMPQLPSDLRKQLTLNLT